MKTKTELDHFETSDCEEASYFHISMILIIFLLIAPVIAVGLLYLVAYVIENIPEDFAQWEAFGITVGFICVAYVVLHMVVRKIKN